MNDPLQQPGGDSPLFPSTREIAGQKAALASGAWRERILKTLYERPSTLWEIAKLYGVPDHTISGRFSELAADMHIERSGERRNHPVSGCPADVWKIRGTFTVDPVAALAGVLGYPDECTIDGDRFDRQPLLKEESYPGLPYARRADTGGVRVNYRLSLVECPGCGDPLKFVSKGVFRCGNPRCNRTWHVALVNETGQPQVLALIMKTM